MSNAENTMHEGESLIYDAVKDMTKDELEQTVRKKAAAKNFDLNDEHMNVIRSLFVHYKQDCKTRDCLTAHEHMRFLEEAYEFKGGRTKANQRWPPNRCRGPSQAMGMSGSALNGRFRTDACLPMISIASNRAMTPSRHSLKTTSIPILDGDLSRLARV